MAKRDQAVKVGGHRIKVSNLDKVLYPSTGTTKGDVIAYYSAIAETMLPHCRDRPATRKRWPDGVGPDGTGGSFFQKDLGDSAPNWLHTREVEHQDHVNTYPLVNDEATLVWLAQLASLEVHVPQWRFDASGSPQNPDRMIFDLDPGQGVPFKSCAKVAFMIRDILRDMGLESIPVTSGSSGIHVYAALDGTQTSDQISSVAKELARSLEADYPDDITSSMKRSLRPGRVFIDWSQNNASKTTVAPYSLRGRIAPTVAAPRSWRELASPHLRHLEFTEVLDRVEKRGDPLADLVKGTPVHNDRLQKYRSMRDASRTPEPVPGPSIDTQSEDAASEDVRRALPQFVIQRHDARRLHYDFRLEHEGVLVSWALPKGVPTDPAKNHLAVPTEDHPFSYRKFEGEIPTGEYGAGQVRIWDAGEYELEKWRDDEVIATLVGRPGGGLGGKRRFALFRAGESGGKPRWMIHLMEPLRSRDREDAAELTPMLAEVGASETLARLDPGEWAFEMKWDGIRAIALVDGERTTLRTRSGSDVTSAYPELANLAAAANAEQVVFDGEIVAFDPDGAPSFDLLQQRFGLTKRRDIEKARRSAPATYLIFDVLSVNGQDSRSLPYRQRSELLKSLVERIETVPVVVPDAFDGPPEDAMEASRSLGLEGVVAKQQQSPYRSGERSPEWLKFPFIATTEAAVIGWRESTADSHGLASLLLATRDSDDESGWKYAGRVGTGFSTKERRAIRARLEPLERKAPVTEVPSDVRRDAHWVKPKLVGEVTSKGRTRAGRFRQPVWRGWRPDKRPDQT
nr:ATP-dependent DNA ligase [Gulosibacter sediminis]